MTHYLVWNKIKVENTQFFIISFHMCMCGNKEWRGEEESENYHSEEKFLMLKDLEICKYFMQIYQREPGPYMILQNQQGPATSQSSTEGKESFSLPCVS